MTFSLAALFVLLVVFALRWFVCACVRAGVIFFFGTPAEETATVGNKTDISDITVTELENLLFETSGKRLGVRDEDRVCV